MCARAAHVAERTRGTALAWGRHGWLVRWLLEQQFQDADRAAGSGYDYLTRQVAALDATEKGHTGLASYYTERGESPGVWIGSGLDGIDGLSAGDPVTAEQMRALFGCGLHPLAELRQQELEGPDLSPRDFQNVARLGAPFRVVDGDVSPFRLEVAKRIAAIRSHGFASGGRCAAGCRPGPSADRGGPRILPRRAWPGQVNVRGLVATAFTHRDSRGPGEQGMFLDLYTLQRILDAQQRLGAAAGRRDGTAVDGTAVDESAVDLALLEMAANKTVLDAGQASLVRQMCTSGVRLQLAIAPAGAGKTTAMRALTLAWTQDGGQVLGLAPSAAAAAVLGEQTGIRADTGGRPRPR